ncbi:retrovirus-related Pol polyprotein from transposon 297 [Trichonephila clavipes]|nr:retrovirus-related Pol polyprotein from transposon 297 [Trichonephila clavipes]
MKSNPWRSNYTQNPKLLSHEHSLSGFPSQSRQETRVPSNNRRNPTSNDRIPEKKIVDTKEDRTPVPCYGFEAAVCADTGATHSVAGEKLYHLLKQKGLNFEEKIMQMTLADGRTQTTEILTTSVDIGIDFLTAAGIVLDLQRKQWYFTDTSHRKYNFVKVPPNINALFTVDTEPHPCQLRENEGGEPTPIIEHRINTRDHLPVAVLPYRMNPSKKEILKQEIDKLLAEGIIEECESPYASPVVLIPKPNGTFRLCIDYKKLNEITVAETYPLPRMDDLLHQAKLTPFMSTLDLRAGYHQVKVHVEDQDKTAFVCPFGTYRYLRMPYGVRNAPAMFQRVMNSFCNGLEDILALPYLDDIIVSSETFEKHMFDLKAIFERLLLFKLKANREKCHFASSRVKYLGFWITQKGIEVDPEKVASILDIPPPKNVKELQSFLQTYSSNYALGTVLLQGEGSDEHTIEYANRLLTPAECNYSTTEREALAVVWALKKFRGYIEGMEITVASDHQPLKWLLNFKSPTG